MHYCDLYATLSGTLIVGAEGLFHTFLPYTTSKAGRSRRRRPESSACDIRSRDDSGRQRQKVAPSADRNVHGPRRLRSVTSASRNVERRYVSERRYGSERRYVSERRDVSEPQRRAPLRQRAVRSHRAATSEDRDDCVA